MRYLSVVLAMLLVAALPMPFAQAQDDAPLAEDDEGDIEATVAGTSVGLLEDRYAAADLRALHWEEQDDGFLVRVEVADLSEPVAPTDLDALAIEVHFTYHQTEFVAEFRHQWDITGTSYTYGQLYTVVEEDGHQYRDYRGYFDPTVDREEHFMEGLLERDAMTDDEGAPPAKGDELDDFWVASHGLTLFTVGGPTGNDPTMEISDRMPDDGTVGPVDVVIGVTQDGDARLSSDAPFRLSNGGASTVVYDVGAANKGERQSFELGLEDVPEGWVVSLPFDRIVLDEGENTTFPVLLTTPSGHSHGGLDAFLLTLTGLRDSGDVGRLELGLKYTDIPQPAGHHPRLYFHSHEPYGSGGMREVDQALGGGTFSYIEPYMNAAEEDPGDLGIDVPARGDNIPGLGGYFGWYISLSPQLGMGLDFATSETATLEVPIRYDYIAQDVELRAYLSYWDASMRDRIQVATAPPSTPASWSQGTHQFELTMDIQKEADFLPYVEGSWLDLVIEVDGDFLGPGPFGPGASPSLAPGGYLDLPLQEYRDPVDRFYKAVEGLRFSTDYLEVPVNPGESVIFETTIRNDGTESEPVVLNLTGVNGDWGRILGTESFKLGSGESRTVAVAVSVPGEVTDGAVADLVLQAASERDAHRRAVIDLIAIVDEEGDHPDASSRISDLDKELQGKDKKAPGFEIAAVGMGLLAVALLLRRRGQ